MKTFEEIFDSIIEKREEQERIRKEELEIAKRNKELKNQITCAYQFVDDFIRRLNDIKRCNGFIENEKIMDLIFEEFREQVENGVQNLHFEKYVNNGIRFELIKDVLLAKLENELPSYDIDIRSKHIYKGNKNQGYNIIITATKNPLKSITVMPDEVKEEIPYVVLCGIDDEIRAFVAQRIFELLETIPQLDNEELFALKEIGIVKEYQPMQLGNISFNRPAKPEIISVRLFSDINESILDEVKKIYEINDFAPLYHREFSYYVDNDSNYVINMLKSQELKEI